MVDDDLGQSVAFSGSTIVAGAPGRETSGHVDTGIADVFVKPHSGWATGTQTRELDPKVAVANLNFGTAAAVLGGQVAVAAEGDDDTSQRVYPAVFEFNEPAAGWGRDPTHRCIPRRGSPKLIADPLTSSTSPPTAGTTPTSPASSSPRTPSDGTHSATPWR